MTIINLIHVNPAKRDGSERSFSSARRLKTWLRSTMLQKRFNKVSIFNNYQDRTDKIVRYYCNFQRVSL